MASSSSALPASLQEATRKATLEWQANLKSLFQHAKDRFPDVVWELTAEDDYDDKVVEEVWGHKGESPSLPPNLRLDFALSSYCLCPCSSEFSNQILFF